MLCLMTLADIEAVSPETLTPVEGRADLASVRRHLQHLTQRYGDELIERNQAGLDRIALVAVRTTCPEAEITQFLEGLPQRYLQLFPRDAIYRHVRLARDIGPDEVHVSLEQNDTVWTLSVVTLDKPFLFSNICGVLSSFGMNILRGQALTNPNGLVLDVFQFTDDERFLALNVDAHAQVLHVLRGRGLRPRRRHGAAPRARAGRAAVAQGARGSCRSSAPTTRRRSATPSSTSLRATRSGCCTGSVVSSHGTAAASSSCSFLLKARRAIDVFPHHEGGNQADRGGAARADVRPAKHTGGHAMKLIKSIVRPNKVDEVKDALARLNISGMTVTEVRGHGKQKGHTAIYRGKEYNVSLLPKMEVEIVVNDSLADEAIKAIVEAARTGEIGDGRVFVFPVLESYRIRTGEKDS